MSSAFNYSHGNPSWRGQSQFDAISRAHSTGQENGSIGQDFEMINPFLILSGLTSSAPSTSFVSTQNDFSAPGGQDYLYAEPSSQGGSYVDLLRQLGDVGRMIQLRMENRQNGLTGGSLPGNASNGARKNDGRHPSRQNTPAVNVTAEAFQVLNEVMQGQQQSSDGIPAGTGHETWTQDEFNQLLDSPEVYQQIIERTGLPENEVLGPDGLIARMKTGFASFATQTAATSTSEGAQQETENSTLGSADIQGLIRLADQNELSLDPNRLPNGADPNTPYGRTPLARERIDAELDVLRTFDAQNIEANPEVAEARARFNITALGGQPDLEEIAPYLSHRRLEGVDMADLDRRTLELAERLDVVQVDPNIPWVDVTRDTPGQQADFASKVSVASSLIAQFHNRPELLERLLSGDGEDPFRVVISGNIDQIEGEGGMPSSTSAADAHGDNFFRIRPGYLWIPDHGTVIHEVTHLVDDLDTDGSFDGVLADLDGESRQIIEDTQQELIRRDNEGQLPEEFSRYGLHSENTVEFTAESVTQFHTRPEVLQQNAPELYQVFVDYFGNDPLGGAGGGTDPRA